MSEKLTKKAMRMRYKTILGTNDFYMQFLLKYQDCIGHSERAEGWACDYYYINDVLISYGYAPINTRGISENSDLIKEYGEKAQEVSEKYRFKYPQLKEAMYNLLYELMEKLKEDYK